MSMPAFDEYEDSDDYDAYDDAEPADDYDEDLEWEEEAYDDEDDDEESRAARRRRAWARAQRRTAQRRATQARSRRVARVARRPVAARTTIAAIRSVDRKSQRADDDMRRELMAQRGQLKRAEYAAVAGVAVNQFLESFKVIDNAYLLALAKIAPLLLLSPQKRGTGVQSVAGDPRVLGSAAVLGLTFLGQQRGKETVKIIGPETMVAGTSARFFARVRAANGDLVKGKAVTWSTADPENDKSVAVVDNIGNVTAIGPGGVVLIVSVTGLSEEEVSLTVMPRASTDKIATPPGPPAVAAPAPAPAKRVPRKSQAAPAQGQ